MSCSFPVDTTRVVYGIAVLRTPPPDSLALEPTGTIHGRVVLSHGEPAARAELRVSGTGRGTITDDQGRYRLALVPVGRQIAYVFHPEERTVHAYVEVGPGDNAISTIRLGMEPAWSYKFFARTRPIEALVPGELVAEIVPARAHWHVDEPLDFSVRIVNRSSRKIIVDLYRVSDRSKIDLKISAPFDAYELPRAGQVQLQDGYISRAEAFVELAPGDGFDPYGGRLGAWLRTGFPRRAGTYTATFRFSMRARRSGVHNVMTSPELLDLLDRVPDVDLVAKRDFKVDF